jgi:diguanylate cyclase (GGDEF)-like protein
VKEKKAPQDPVALRHTLLELLEADPPHEEKLLARFERLKGEGPVYSSILYILTHLRFSETVARKHWERIRSHRDSLQMQLGRDMGLRVALLDYFVNLNRELKNPKIIEIAIYERTERSAVTDGLTGLFNHAFFLQALKREVNRCKRHNLEMSLAMFDLDDFKKLNDTRGHLEGDRVLMKASALIKDALRDVDVAARYGGEEFAAILPDTAKQGARIVAERIRERIHKHFRKHRGGPKVSVSGGVATFPEDATGMEDLIRRADAALYRSKAEGKNRITLAQPERRGAERIVTDHPVVLVPGAGQKAARAKNISRSGMLVSLPEPVPVGSAVSLTIRAVDAPPMALRGEVVRVDRATGRVAAYDVAVRLSEEPKSPMALLRRPAKPA